jgi:hypothetical protein
MKSISYSIFLASLCSLLMVPVHGAEPRNLEEALLNYTWEWIHAPQPPDALTFSGDGNATCYRFAWKWKITGPRTVVAYDPVLRKTKLTGTWQATLKFDATLSSLEATSSEGKHHYTGRRLMVTPSDVESLSRAITSSKWSWVVQQPNPDPWDERQFTLDGTATAWRRGVMMCSGKWEVTGPRTIRIQNISSQKNVHILTFDQGFSRFDGSDGTGQNGYTGVKLGPAISTPVTTAPLATVQTDPNQPLLDTFSQLAPNASAWVLAGLDEGVPPNVRQNLTYIREDLLDEYKQKPKASQDAYKLAHQLCTTMINALDERDQTLVRAGFRAVQADASISGTNQALEVRRNYMMSWPQYAREQAQRAELIRQGTAGAQVGKALPKVEWSTRTAKLRKTLDDLYAQFREALRQSAAVK